MIRLYNHDNKKHHSWKLYEKLKLPNSYKKDPETKPGFGYKYNRHYNDSNNKGRTIDVDLRKKPDKKPGGHDKKNNSNKL